MFYALYDEQTGRYMSTGLNSLSISELGQEFYEFIKNDLDPEEDEENLDVLKEGKDEFRIRRIIEALDYNIEKCEIPFPDGENLNRIN